MAAGQLFLASPPLYRLQPGRPTVYARDDAHKDELMRTIFAEAKGKVEVSRFKGLGEMPPRKPARHHHGPGDAHPAARDGAGEGRAPNSPTRRELVESLMGRKPELRYAFIQEKAKFAKDLDV